jgi:hypothetical protein
MWVVSFKVWWLLSFWVGSTISLEGIGSGKHQAT